MLENVIGFIPDEEYKILSRIETTLVERYEYNVHHTRLSNLITELLDNKDANKFYGNVIDLYKLTANKLLGILGVSLSLETTLQDRTTILIALTDINNKDEYLKNDVYASIDNYEGNVNKLVHVLTGLHVLEDAVILNDIFEVSDDTIELIEDMLSNNEDNVKEDVLEKLLIGIVKDVTGTEDMETISILSASIGLPMREMLSKHKNLLYTTSNEVITNLLIMLVFSSSRDDLTVAYLMALDSIDDSTAISTFMPNLLDKAEALLIEKGIIDAK